MRSKHSAAPAPGRNRSRTRSKAYRLISGWRTAGQELRQTRCALDRRNQDGDVLRRSPWTLRNTRRQSASSGPTARAPEKLSRASTNCTGNWTGWRRSLPEDSWPVKSAYLKGFTPQTPLVFGNRCQCRELRSTIKPSSNPGWRAQKNRVFFQHTLRKHASCVFVGNLGLQITNDPPMLEFPRLFR